MTRQQEATVAITDSEGITVVAITGFELALEVIAQDVVGSQELGRGSAGMADEATVPFLWNQAMTAQNLTDGCSMGPRPAGLFLAEDLEQFLGSPAGV